jgi:rhomboid-like protein
LTLTACAFPDSNVGIIFVPFISFPIGLGVAGMVAVDLVGLIRGWRWVSRRWFWLHEAR